MKISCLFDAMTLEELEVKINQYFNTEVRIIRSELSVFEQYEVRPKNRVFVEEIWKYRIVAKQGKYFFGKI
jgi:hypothetical protein